MKRILGICAVATILGSASGISLDWKAHFASGERPRIDLDLVDAKPADVFPVFARILEAELELDPLVDRLVTVRLKNVRIESALGVVCESIGCLAELDPGLPARLRVSFDENAAPESGRTESGPRDRSLLQPISLSLAGASLSDVLSSFGKVLQAEVDLPPDLSGEVTLEMQNAPAGDALDQVCSTSGLAWRLVESASGRRLEIRKGSF